MASHKVVGQNHGWRSAPRAAARGKGVHQGPRRVEPAATRTALGASLVKTYRFEGPRGSCSLPDLFDGSSQLVIYHFMLGPDWEAGCKSCSFLADNFAGIGVHLKHRDTTLALVSRAPRASIQAYQATRYGLVLPLVLIARQRLRF